MLDVVALLVALCGSHLTYVVGWQLLSHHLHKKSSLNFPIVLFNWSVILRGGGLNHRLRSRLLDPALLLRIHLLSDLVVDLHSYFWLSGTGLFLAGLLDLGRLFNHCSGSGGAIGERVGFELKVRDIGLFRHRLVLGYEGLSRHGLDKGVFLRRGNASHVSFYLILHTGSLWGNTAI